MSEKYLDSSLTPEERAEDLLGRLSIEEKVYQISGIWAQMIDEPGQIDYGIGQVSTLEMRQKKTMRECVDWQIELQKKVMEKSPHHIPATFHMEGLCGAFIQDAMSFPSGIGRGSSFDVELEEKIGKIVSRQEQAVGITQVLAPVLDVTQDPRMGRQGETYGEDPTLNGLMGASYTRGIQDYVDADNGRRCDACAKHFMGFHKSTGGIHGADVSVSDREMIEKFGKPFQIAIKDSNLRGIMPCYCTSGGSASSSNKKMLTQVLREEMGFDGEVLADYGAIGNQHRFQGLYETMDQAGYASIRAGMDVELPMREAYNDDFIAKFKSGEYDMQYLDRAVKQALTAKFRQGLFEHPFAYTGQELEKKFYGNTEEDKKISLQSARESMVLLKNDGTLPVKNHTKKIVLVGPQAKNARFFFGGYTHLSMAEAPFAAYNAMAGVDIKSAITSAGYQLIPGTNIQSDDIKEMDDLLILQKPDCRSLLEKMQEMMPETEVVWTYGYPIAGDDCSHHAEALKAMEGADLVIFMLGGKHGSCSVSSMGEGVDGTNINLPICQDVLIQKAAELKIPMVGVHMNGRPISSDIADKYLNAIIEAWNPSEMGAQAIAETLLGINNPSGKMPVTTAIHAGQLPLQYNLYNGSAWSQGDSIGFKNYVDCSHRPRYAFGRGLSYTTFEYSNLSCNKEEVAPDETVQLSFTLTNTGNLAGTEIVQIYGKDVYASLARPMQELIGFARVTLQPQETKKIQVEVSPSQMAFLDEDMQWKIEKGEIKLRIGSSSEDIRLESSFSVTEDAFIKSRDRVFVARVE